VQQELLLSYSSHLAKIARRSDISTREAILIDLTVGMQLSQIEDSSTRASTEI
jgi:hypothetical protein